MTLVYSGHYQWRISGFTNCLTGTGGSAKCHFILILQRVACQIAHNIGTNATSTPGRRPDADSSLNNIIITVAYGSLLHLLLIKQQILSYYSVETEKNGRPCCPDRYLTCCYHEELFFRKFRCFGFRGMIFAKYSMKASMYKQKNIHKGGNIPLGRDLQQTPFPP
jgi:hypothetical protein